jgi:hypothetical protein
MNTIRINNYNYSLCEFLFNNAPIFCKGSRSTRDLIKKKNIDSKYYIYAKYDSKINSWTITDGKSAKMDKVLIRHSYLKTINELSLNNKINEDESILKAPEILELKDSEKFKDQNNNIIEIETRGERKYDQIYFKVKDVSVSFDMPNLYRVIVDTDGNYKLDVDYKYFTCYVKINSSNQTSKKIIVTKELFLTYEGILRVLFVSRNNKTKQFIKWATEILFTVQIGIPEQKNILISNMLGCSAKVVKEVFNADANTIPCVYLFTFGYVKDLRSSMNIDKSYKDDSIVAKYGFTKDLSRRTGEHIKNFGNISNVDLKLKYYSYIDPQYISNAETDMKELFESLNIKLNYENFKELIIIPNIYNKIISEKYNHIGKKYTGHISELITKIKNLEDINQKQELNHKIELQKQQYENKLKDSQLEILQYKILMLQNNITPFH